MTKKRKKKLSNRFFNWLYSDKETITSLKRMPYYKYLKTKHWKATRAKRVRLSKYKCDLCGLKARRLEVHHKHYRNRGNERMGDLLTLCYACHRKQHPDK